MRLLVWSAVVAFTFASGASQPANRQELRRDLSIDEASGGHTLSRHVGRSDAQLAERLRREPGISAASTYTDRETAERTVGAAIANSGGMLSAWEHRHGRRPNLVLHYVPPRDSGSVDHAGATVGRSLSRGQTHSVACDRAIVVLRWDERSNRYFVLTSYPETPR